MYLTRFILLQRLAEMNSKNLEERNIGVVAPHLVDEWDFEKNGLTPEQVFGGSVKKFWWKCLKEKHSWEASPNARTRGNGCPYCSGTKILSGVTDFGTVYPEYVEFWDEKKNKKPIDKTSSTNGTVFLFCDKAHEYSLDLSSIKRAHENNKVVRCTLCSGKKIVSGINDFATFYPEFVQYIDFDKNNPEKIYYRKYSAIHWKCSKNHLFSSRIEIALRDSEFHCPYCEHKFLLTGFNDVKTFFGEEICEIWSSSNSNLPQNTIYHNDMKYVFKCQNGHSWAQVIDYTAGFNSISCIYCSGENKNAKITKIVVGVNDLATTHPEFAKMISNESKNQANNVSAGSKKRVLIECINGHKRELMVKNLVNGSKQCQQCVREENNLLKKIPNLPERLDLDKNTVEDIKNLTIGSRTIVHLKCKGGHRWEIKPYNIEKWGGCPYCSSQRVLQGFNDIPTTAPELLKIWNYEKNGEMNVYPEDYTAGSHKKVWWKCDKDHEYLSPIGNRKLYGCPECAQLLRTSKGEKEVCEFVKSILPAGTVVLENDRTIIRPKELDIYIPEKKIAIEYNGLYWHSEEMLKQRNGGSAKNYHYDKWKACNDAGIQLITVWEDEWRDKPEVVKSMLSHKLGLSNSEKVFGRNALVLDIDGDTAKDFCNKYHIQGFASGAKYFALVNKNDLSEIFAVSVWRKVKEELYLDRYCTSKTVVGGMGKLLKAGETWGKAMGCSQIVTFADHQVSNGGLYHSLGFRVDKILKPDYRYIHEGLRKHKFGFRLKRFRNDPALKYVEGYTEKQLAELNDLPRLWDFGKTRFVKEIV